MLTNKLKHFFVLLVLVFSSQAIAMTVSDDFTQATDSNNWVAQYYACLTAGSSSVATTNANYNGGGNSKIPGCNYGTPNAAGSGALRLTPASGNQHGAIVSNYTFPSNQGLAITFTTYTYGGSANGLASDGADGLSFFLQDGSVGTTLPDESINLGSWGGSLAYTCSNANSPYTGLTGAYLGLGIDEWGNFLNGGSGNDNTATGITNQLQTSSTNTACTSVENNGCNWFTNGSGNTQQANRIGLRGAGNVSWYWLNQNYPSIYPSTLSSSTQNAAVQNTCKTGTLWDYSNSAATSQSISSASPSGTTLTVSVPSVTGYINGDSVTIGGGTFTVTPQTQSIISATVSGKTMTVSVPSTTGYSNGQGITIGGAITATPVSSAVSSYSNYSASKVRVNVGSASSNYSAGESISISGATGTNAGVVNTTFTISSVTTGSSGYLVIPVASNAFGGTPTYPTGGTVTGATPTIPNAYSVSSLNTGANTFQVTLSFAATAIANTSGTVTGAAPTIPNTYTISGVDNVNNTFQVTLSSMASAVSFTGTPTVTDNSQNTSGRNLGVTQSGSNPNLLDYAVIPGGYWVLPGTQLIAKESTSTRTSATPITYKLQITPAGLLTFLYSYNGGAYQSVLSNWDITTANGPMPSNFRFGFAGSTGGATNVHEITCFQAEPLQSASSAGANTSQAGQYKTSLQVYFANYNNNSWLGSLVSDAVTANMTTGAISVATNATWDGNCTLTGGGCTTMGTDSSGNALNTITVEPPLSPSTNGLSNSTTAVTASTSPTRQLLTWNAGGVPLEWASLSSAQQTVLSPDNTTNGQYRLNWLRGDRSKEQTASPAGPLRVRSGVLGDIVDSSPAWVGPPSAPYLGTFVDALYPTATASESSYPAFSANYATRLNVVYSGSNDGLVHGFRTGGNNTDGSYNSSLNDGYEVIGYMPAGVLANSNIEGLTMPTYGHNYFIDAVPGTGDLYYGGAWHTWLVGGLGAGGAEIYALDVTDPTGAVTTNSAFTESNASNLVLGDWTSSTITCKDVTGATIASCGNYLGNTYGTPAIRRLHNGKWAIIFGNGSGGSNGIAGVFIGLVDNSSTSTGAVTFYWLSTGVGSSGSPNGIYHVSPADLDGDHITDYLYAGDLNGNVWRFDLTSSNIADWGASKFGRATATPLYIAKDGSGNTQPITTKIVVTEAFTGSAYNVERVILGFGTGKSAPFTTSSATTYASGAQSVYGIWDWDMTKWNAGQTTANSVVIPGSSTQLAALSGGISGQPPEVVSTGPTVYRTFTRTNLLTNTALQNNAAGTRTSAISSVCWQGSLDCPNSINTSTTDTQGGWLYDLPDTNEQIVYNPILVNGELLVNTTTPPGSQVGCTPSLPLGSTMAFSMVSGGGAAQNVFQNSSNSFVISTNSSAVGSNSITGIKSGAVGSPFIVCVGSNCSAISQTSGGGTTTPQTNLQGGVKVTRKTWEQLR